MIGRLCNVWTSIKFPARRDEDALVDTKPSFSLEHLLQQRLVDQLPIQTNRWIPLFHDNSVRIYDAQFSNRNQYNII